MKAAEEDYRRALDLAGPERGGSGEARILASLGEIRYWLGEFEPAVPALERAEARRRRPRGPSAGLAASATSSSRSWGTPSELPSCSTTRSTRRAGSAIRGRSRGRCWSPRGRRTSARTPRVPARCSRRRSRPRARPEGDRWSEARSLVGLSTLESDEGDEEGRSGSQRRRSRSRRPVGTASRSPSPTRRWRHAAPHDASRRGRVSPGRRGRRVPWARRTLELASALTSRGIERRLAGEADEAVRTCSRPTASAVSSRSGASSPGRLPRSPGRTSARHRAARRVLEETASVASEETAATEDWLDYADVEILLAEGERDAALERAVDPALRARRRVLEGRRRTGVVDLAGVRGRGRRGGDRARPGAARANPDAPGLPRGRAGHHPFGDLGGLTARLRDGGLRPHARTGRASRRGARVRRGRRGARGGRGRRTRGVPHRDRQARRRARAVRHPVPRGGRRRRGRPAPFCLCLEEIGRYDSSLAITLEAAVGLAANPLFRFGTDEQRERWLVPMARGEAIGAFALTEPGGGSTPARSGRRPSSTAMSG